MPRRRPEVVIPWAAIGLVTVAALALFHPWRADIPSGTWLGTWGLTPAGFWDPPVTPRHVVRLFTAIVVHVDLWHLLGNAVFLALFAPRVEARLGALRALALYLFCGALANGLTTWEAASSSAVVVGASGTVSALLGAFMVLFPHARIGLILPLGLYFQVIRVPSLTLIGGWFVLQLMYTFWLPGVGAVAWWTHVNGFLSGLILAAPARWYTPPTGERSRMR